MAEITDGDFSAEEIIDRMNNPEIGGYYHLSRHGARLLGGRGGGRG